MARILLGWELGAGSGHLRRLSSLAEALRAAGHDPVCAFPVLGGAPDGVPLWQSPLWPSQMVQTARLSGTAPATMADILVALGISRPGALAGMLRGWDSILGAVRPDLVIAEFAPALALAIRGRVPLVVTGTGFSLPPADLDAMPSLTGRPAAHPEAAVLARINRGLADTGRTPIDRVAALFGGDARIVSTFAELDPYSPLRRERLTAPEAPIASAPATRGDEIFVYMGGSQSFLPDFWRDLAARGLPVRMYDPRLGTAEIDLLERHGVTMERQPVPFERIALRSRLLISYGSLGFASAALIAGLPQVVIPYDIEKAMIAAALGELGVARVAGGAAGGGEALLDLVEEAYRDAALLGTARGRAPDFAARMQPSASEATLAAVEALLARAGAAR